MTIQIDTREKPHAIKQIVAYFEKAGIKHFRSALPVGDYISLDNARLAIDRKQNLQELCGNICQQHDRFRSELIRANDLGIQLVFLVEHSNRICTLSDVRHWKNPRLAVSPYALDGYELYRRLCTIEVKYNTAFYFCTKRETGAYIIDILTNGGKPYQITINSKGD